ncbi:MAG: Hsp70 family protein, partial [Deltaproteobacteria bacterium]|nr:Hsp70 family protein [Deltaproteobacteria bacterium]
MPSGPPKPRPQRQQFDSRVRFVVSDRREIRERFAANLSEGGLFIRDDSPPSVGSLILIEFVLPGGGPLCRAAARVVHARPATAPGDKTAGMGLEFVKLDQVAQEIARTLDREQAPASAETDASEKRLLALDGMERPILAPTGPVVGIDLGTVNSCVAVVENGTPRVVLSPEGYDVLPSVVFLAADGKLYVGHKALARMILEPQRAIYGAKRFLGRPFVSREVQTYGHFFNYELVPGSDGRTAAKVGEQTIDLEEVSGQILLKLREMAEQQLGQGVARAVVTVPAYFGETQRQAVREAARRAGITVERILNEPTAAAVAYGYGRSMTKTILVYDLGGGTFDATLLRIRDNTFEVLATDGDPFLGGADFDDRLTEYVLSSFERDQKVSLRGDAVAVQRIRFAVELAKRQLSELTSTDIDLTYITQSERGAIHLHMTLERELFERLTQDLVDRTLGLVQVVLDRAGITSDTLDDVLAVGGQSRSPHVQRALIERFGRRPSTRVHPTEVVALGAA